MTDFVDPDAVMTTSPKGFVDPDAPNVKPSSIAERIGTGIGDLVNTGAQMLTHALPKGIVEAGNKLNNTLADAGLPLGRIPEGGMDQMINQRESEYEAKRKAAGSEGFDWARTAGNVANPANYVAGPVTGGLLALTGAPVVNKDNFWTEKAKQAGIAAATMGAVRVGGNAISRVISPQTTEAVKDLTSKGIAPTLGQILGGTAKTMEDKLMSLPVVGDVIAHARRGAVGDLNRSLYDMALEPIGAKSTAQIGREGVKEVQDKLSSAYGSLLQGKTIPLDAQFGQEVSNIFNTAGGIMSNDARQQFMNILKNKVLNVRNPQGMVDGEMMKAMDTQLGQMSRQFGREQNVNSQMIGDGLDQVQQALRDAVGRADPALQDGLNKVNQGWSIYARIRNAASRTGAKEGIVMPGTLSAAVTKLDNSVAKGGTATGTAPMRQFSDHVNEVLGGQYPDSGTAGRTLLNLLLTGGGMMLHPTGMMIAGAAALPSIARRTTAALMTSRPWQAPIAAEAAQNAAQAVAPGLAEAAAR